MFFKHKHSTIMKLRNYQWFLDYQIFGVTVSQLSYIFTVYLNWDPQSTHCNWLPSAMNLFKTTGSPFITSIVPWIFFLKKSTVWILLMIFPWCCYLMCSSCLLCFLFNIFPRFPSFLLITPYFYIKNLRS